MGNGVTLSEGPLRQQHRAPGRQRRKSVMQQSVQKVRWEVSENFCYFMSFFKTDKPSETYKNL